MSVVSQAAANVAHAATHAPVATTVQGWTVTSYIMLLVAIMNALGLGGALVAWIKSRGVWRKNDMDADAKLRDEMWKDIATLKASKENMAGRLTLAETKLQGQAIEIGQLRFVLKLLNDELETVSPGNVIARQCRELLKNIQPTAMPAAEEVAPMADIIAKLCKDGEQSSEQP